ncbi:MAG: cytochrome P450 [Alphaproteobacteria bacterium]
MTDDTRTNSAGAATESVQGPCCVTSGEEAAAELFTPEFAADPYPTYRKLREGAPFFKLPGTDMWIATRYQDCAALLKDKRLGHRMRERIEANGGPEILEHPAYASLLNMMLVADPPDHTRLRGLVTKAFDRRGVEALRPRIREIAHELIDVMEPEGGGDLVKYFTHKLPVIVICDMLGIPEEDRSRFTDQRRVNGRLIDPTPMSPEELEAADANTLETRAYFEGLFEARRAEPQDDLLTALVESETEHGRLTRDELAANVSLLFGAGHETTVNLMGNGLLALYRNPDQLAALKAEPALWPNAVEEFLRYDSSVQLTGRTAFEEVEIAGETVRAGEEVLALLGAANRDPEIFEDPDRLNIRRENIRPLSFGGGIHFCLGAQLARIEAAEALPILLERLPRLELTELDRPKWKSTITLRGLTELPARW